jgi:hypothetical protein
MYIHTGMEGSRRSGTSIAQLTDEGLKLVKIMVKTDHSRSGTSIAQLTDEGLKLVKIMVKTDQNVQISLFIIIPFQISLV